MSLARFFSTLVLLLSPIASMNAKAELSKNSDFVEIAGRKIFVSYRQAEAGKPTIVLLNGLTYSLENWDQYVAALEKHAPGLGILRFDMIGMGKTLLKNRVPVDYEIPYTDQAKLTARLMQKLGLRKAYIAGLSYGGGIAVAFARTYPELVNQIILIAPFTEPLKDMDRIIRSQVVANRLTFPLNPAKDDELYDFFLKQFIYSSYPPLEPSVLENPYKLEGVFRMVQGIRKYDTVADSQRLPNNSVHLIVANQDQYIQKEVHDRFWNNLPTSVRASRIDISFTEHKIPESIPNFAAAWTAEILKGRAELNQGLTYQGSTRNSSAKSEKTLIQLPR